MFSGTYPFLILKFKFNSAAFFSKCAKAADETELCSFEL